MKTICVTGAAGNLGNLTAQMLVEQTIHNLHLMVHSSPLRFQPTDLQRVKTFSCDLAHKQSLRAVLTGVDLVIHFAGVLFRADPESFLPTTNTRYFANLLEVAKECGVKQIVLISFPHVEGETSPEHPSTDRMDGTPTSHHARTRLEEERLLFGQYPGGISLRVGMVYGRGILMPDAARWFAKRHLLGVWKKPTHIHLVSKDDFLAALRAVADSDTAHGIYNLGDEGQQTLQEYLDFACKAWGCAKPWRMPEGLIFAAARIFEFVSRWCGTKSPLTVDFVRIGMASYYGDTTRLRRELLPTLKHPTMRDGIDIF